MPLGTGPFFMGNPPSCRIPVRMTFFPSARKDRSGRCAAVGAVVLGPRSAGRGFSGQLMFGLGLGHAFAACGRVSCCVGTSWTVMRPWLRQRPETAVPGEGLPWAVGADA